MSFKYKMITAPIVIDKLISHLNAVRTGNINSSVLDNVSVNVPSWGGEFKIVELATVNKLDATTLMITAFDSKVLNDIYKALEVASLGAQPVNTGAGIKLAFPPMTEEGRKNKVKELKKYEEESKIEVRNIRQHALKKIKADKENNLITEDDVTRLEKDVQFEVDTVNKEIEEIIKQKSVEIMKI